MEKKWGNTLTGNQFLNGKDFWISYSAFPGMGSSLSEGYCGAETALCSETHKYGFLILDGDFRKEYEKLIGKGYAACKKFYKSKKEEHRSSWSEN